MTTIEIGNSIESIGNFAFGGCSIKEYYCYALTPPSLGRYPFGYSAQEGVTLYVPARKGSAYQSSDWRIYFTNIVEID